MLLDLFSPPDLREVEPVSAQESRNGGTIATPRPKSSSSFSPLLEQPRGILFLDIETTGLSRYYDYVTLIGFAIDGNYEVIVAGEDPQPLLDALARAQSLVTFNGSGFDLPFLEDTLGEVSWPRHHVDLRYACKAIGHTGGQKEIEQALGVACRAGVEGVDGAAAVVLWHRYMRGDRAALRDLIAYNRADVEAMGHILEHVVRRRAATDLFLRPDELRRLCSTPLRSRRFRSVEEVLPAPPIHLRRVVHFDGLFRGTPAEGATVVGLDLTGSAERPSGFSLMTIL
jgi:hypothetical protein